MATSSNGLWFRHQANCMRHHRFIKGGPWCAVVVKSCWEISKDQGLGGRLTSEQWDADIIAAWSLFDREPDGRDGIAKGMAAAIRVGLIVEQDGAYLIRNWEERQQEEERRAYEAERKRRMRSAKSAKSRDGNSEMSQFVPRDNAAVPRDNMGVPRDNAEMSQCPSLSLSREEKSRVEKSREDQSIQEEEKERVHDLSEPCSDALSAPACKPKAKREKPKGHPDTYPPEVAAIRELWMDAQLLYDDRPDLRKKDAPRWDTAIFSACSELGMEWAELERIVRFLVQDHDPAAVPPQWPGWATICRTPKKLLAVSRTSGRKFIYDIRDSANRAQVKKKFNGPVADHEFWKNQPKGLNDDIEV